MKASIISIIITVLTVSCLYGQSDLNESIVAFEANCLEVLEPDHSFDRFRLIKYAVDDQSTIVQFTVLANCARQQKGRLALSRDTLLIDSTDVTITSRTYQEVTDSDTFEITEESYITDLAACDCLMQFYYEFSTSLPELHFLSFHSSVFGIKEEE